MGGGVITMKKSVFLIVGLFLVSIFLINGFKGEFGGGGDEWQEGINWTMASITKDEIVAADKPVYLFVTTDWCTFCKKMKANTFTDPKVQKLLNELFVAIPLNPEKTGTANFTGEALPYSDLAKKLRVNGYPASFFFAPDGQLIGSQPGYVDAKSFADMAEYVGDGHYKNYSFAKFQALPADQRR